MTIDGSNAGVILDGSGLSATPETLLLDDVSLSMNGGSNLIENGDFSTGLGHWRPDDDAPALDDQLKAAISTRRLVAIKWTVTAHAGDSTTIYDTTNTDDPFDNHPYDETSTVWIPATGGSTVDLQFWYRYGGLSVELIALFANGDDDDLIDQGFGWQSEWTEATFSTVVPDEATGVAVQFRFEHSSVRRRRPVC